ncbi:NAD(P)/FAD-dependent oxidoreductase [Pseudomonas sp. GX19020]|uniref:NAD(P)/FAD-dependent oxidoreductase n=1 Tax=Pseudomonas sp. GX19020 TaxID=2942277 RepID=UPI002018A2E1|nr:NAD(P)/FAD-dependent oxidoreductase [Pseudomonas sp. GX19020]MCL4067948.1 NAD(P)/FAD-dependent oxidoreductase [Pseudomonas sp. GX19020]
MTSQQPPHLVVIGAGFAGLQTVQALKGAGLRITLIDQRNHHLFQPLLYQVATTILAPSEIAWPIRSLMEHRPDVTTLMARVRGIDPDRRQVITDDGAQISYDMLVIATGATHAYFGHPEWEPNAPGLKTIEDATRIRNRILLAFERAETEPDPAQREALLTFGVIGGGPTGVELAGMLADLARNMIRGEFRNIDTSQTRVLLIEASKRILPSFPEDLSAYAARALERRGVDLRFGTPVTDCTEDGVQIGDEFLPCRTLIWAAGVAASPAADWLGVEGDKAGRVRVQSDLTVAGRPEIFVIGDTAAVVQENGDPVPGIAPAAKQQGSHVAGIIRARLKGEVNPAPFHYRHQGDLATIGKRAAVVKIGRLSLKGALAWWIWGIAHIFFLIGTRSRASVAWNWLWTYLRGQNSGRLIAHPKPGDEPAID